MKEKWLTIKEASKLSHKSENTIRRLIKDAHLDNHDYSNGYPNDYSKLICKKYKTKRGLHWIIREDSLFKILGLVTQTSTRLGNLDKLMSTQNDYSLITQKDEMIKMLQERINSLEQQLTRKDHHISELLERNRELNLILAKQEQQKQLEYKKKGFTRRFVDIILKS